MTSVKPTVNDEMFRLLVSGVRDYAIFMLDPTGHVATWNAGAQHIKGYSAAEIIGRHFSAFYPRADIDAGKCEYELEVAAREGRFEDEGWRVRKDGTEFWANVVITALRNAADQLVGFAKVTRDLTERRRAEEERAARIAAERASRAKDEFLALLGHELRNPLAPIVTALELLRLRGEPLRKEHEVIERQVSHMMRLVDDLLDVARITRGKVALETSSLDLRDVVSDALEIVAPLIEERAHHVAVDLPARPVVLLADRRRMLQVVTNLLTNAVKYTQPCGQIRVALAVADGHATLEIHDNGQGIPPELLPRVFELFVQGEQTPERAAGGLGLGLTLVQSIVQLHGGRVAAYSAGPGQGSVFSVTMPLGGEMPATAAPRRELASLAGSSPPKRVLVVDDNEDARELLAELLETVGYDVKAVGDAHDALALVGDFRPELAILDLGLPDVDGFELARRLSAPAAGTAPRLIALSGYAQNADRERSRAAGFEVHLVKPVDTGQLLEVLGTLGGS